jgi:hypothetical protein
VTRAISKSAEPFRSFDEPSSSLKRSLASGGYMGSTWARLKVLRLSIKEKEVE